MSVPLKRLSLGSIIIASFHFFHFPAFVLPELNDDIYSFNLFLLALFPGLCVVSSVFVHRSVLFQTLSEISSDQGCR